MYTYIYIYIYIYRCGEDGFLCGVVNRVWVQVFDASEEALSAATNVNRFKDQALEEPGVIYLEKSFAQRAAERKEAVVHQLMVGNCGSGAGGDFSFSNGAAAGELGFQVEPASGKVDAGAKIPVLITYTPPPGAALAVWNEIVLEGSLSGGAPATSLTVQVRLRGFVPAQL